MQWRWVLAVGLAVPTAFQAEAQAPADGGVRLAWVRGVGAEQCPDGATLEAEVARRLGRDPFREPVSQTLEGAVRRTAEGAWVVELHHRDATDRLLGTRRLASEGEDCSSLASAAALAIALTISPDALAPPPVTVSRPAEGPEEEPGKEPDEKALAPAGEVDDESSGRAGAPAEETPDDGARARGVRRAPRPGVSDPGPTWSRADERPHPSVRAKLGALFSWGLVPGFAPGLILDVDGRVAGPVRFLVGTLYVPEQRTGKTTADFGFGVTAARVGACLRSCAPRWSIGGCASPFFGRTPRGGLPTPTARPRGSVLRCLEPGGGGVGRGGRAPICQSRGPTKPALCPGSIPRRRS